MIAELILSIMLTLQPPGQTLYSVVEVTPASRPACADRTNLLCAEPRYDATRGVWLRPESAAEGLERYRLIAQTIHRVATGDVQLARYLVLTTYHESGWRRDVHSGVGPSARGDRGQAWCLGQILLGTSGGRRVTEGWRARELVGVDAAATERCLIVTTRVLRGALEGCRRSGDGSPECVLRIYAGGRAAPKRIRERLRTWYRLDRLLSRQP